MKNTWKLTHLIAIIFLFSSIYLIQYTREYNLRQKICYEKSLDQVVWITRPPMVGPYGYQVDTGDATYLFSQQVVLQIGDQYRVISTPKDISQCIRSAKKVLTVRSISKIKDLDVSVYSLLLSLPQRVAILVGKYLQLSEHEIRANLPLQHAEIALGMVLGRKIPSQSQTSVMMSTAGVSHILVASGANLVLLLSFTHAVMRIIFSRKATENISVILILIYLLIVGFQAPILRAGVFFLLLVFVKRIGRQVSAMYLLLLTAIIMLIFQPFLLYSVSFWLSLSASFALLSMEREDSMDSRASRNIFMHYGRETMRSSLLVFFFTAPILIFTFGSLRPITLVSNLIVLWLVGPISVYGMFVVLSLPLIPSLFIPIFLLPLWFLEEVFVRLINLISIFPFPEIALSNPQLWGVICAYIGISCTIFVGLADRGRKR